jgi:hypothetical protein
MAILEVLKWANGLPSGEVIPFQSLATVVELQPDRTAKAIRRHISLKESDFFIGYFLSGGKLGRDDSPVT